MEYFINEKIPNEEVNLDNHQGINSNPETATLGVKQEIKKPFKKRFWKTLGIILGIFLVVLLIGYFILIRPGYTLYKDSLKLYATANELKLSLSEQNLTKAEQSLGEIKSELLVVEKDYERLGVLKYTPFLSKYYKDGSAVFSAANHGVIASDLVIQGIEPFSNIFGFTSDKANEEEINADQKLEELVQAMPQLLPSLDAALEEIDNLESDLQEVNPEDYPKSILGYDVQEKITEIKNLTTSAKKVSHDVRPILEKLPEALGEPETKNYLVLFQNDKELRPTGGFITAYAIISMDKGRFKIVKSEDVYNIDKDQSYMEAPQAIKDYLVPGLYMRDSNWSPDFKVSMETFEIYWNKLADVPEISGIIGVDTEFVRAFMEVLGPIELPQYGETFEASNVVYELELYSEKVLQGPYRKNLLGDLMGEMVDRVFAAKKDQWRSLIDKAFTEISRKHMLFYFHDTTLQSFAEEYNFAGRIKEFDGDYLHVSDANLGGLKSDYWLERNVDQKINIADDGTVTKEVSITYNNRGAYDGWLNSTTRVYTRIYVPLGSTLNSIEGGDDEKAKTTSEDLGKTVFSNYSRTIPLSSKTIKFTYTLPFKVTGTGLFGTKEYKLLVQKQPGLGQPQPDLKRPQYTIEINGEVKADYELLTDSEFTWEL